MQTRSAVGVAAALADEEAVVQDVVVAERRALREARRAARVLDVDRVVEVERRPRARPAPSPATASPRGAAARPSRRCRGRRPARAPAASARTSATIAAVVARLERRSRRRAAGSPTGAARTRSSWVRYAGLMLTRITPILAVAYCTSTHSALFGLQMPTRSPLLEAEGEQAAGHARRPRRRARRRSSGRPGGGRPARRGRGSAAPVSARFSPIVWPSSGTVEAPCAYESTIANPLSPEGRDTTQLRAAFACSPWPSRPRTWPSPSRRPSGCSRPVPGGRPGRGPWRRASMVPGPGTGATWRANRS